VGRRLGSVKRGERLLGIRCLALASKAEDACPLAGGVSVLYASSEYTLAGARARLFPQYARDELSCRPNTERACLLRASCFVHPFTLPLRADIWFSKSDGLIRLLSFIFLSHARASCYLMPSVYRLSSLCVSVYRDAVLTTFSLSFIQQQ
jgi:hypothetical protein